MSVKEFEFNADFLRWLAGQDAQFLDFMFRYYREMLALEEAGIGAKPPTKPTGKVVRIRYARTQEEIGSVAAEMVREHNRVNRIPDRSKFIKKGPISADEIADFHRSISE